MPFLNPQTQRLHDASEASKYHPVAWKDWLLFVEAALFYRLARTKLLIHENLDSSPDPLEDKIDCDVAMKEFLLRRRVASMNLAGTEHARAIAHATEDQVCDLFLPQI